MLFRSEFEEDEIEEKDLAILDEKGKNINGHDVNLNFKKVRKGQKWGIINTLNNTIEIPLIYDEIKQSDKLKRMKVRNGDYWGVYDCSTWSETIPIIYNDIEAVFWTSFFIVELNGKFGVIDINNSIKIPIIYDSILQSENSSNIHFNVLEGDYWYIYNDEFLISNDIKKSTTNIYNEYFTANFNETFGLFNKCNKLVFPCFCSKIIY